MHQEAEGRSLRPMLDLGPDRARSGLDLEMKQRRLRIANPRCRRLTREAVRSQFWPIGFDLQGDDN
jgi:hypothetical protein